MTTIEEMPNLPRTREYTFYFLEQVFDNGQVIYTQGKPTLKEVLEVKSVIDRLNGPVCGIIKRTAVETDVRLTDKEIECLL